MERREPNPLRLFNFLDFEELGVELVGGLDVLKVKSVKPSSLLAQAGVRMGDRIKAIGMIKVESIDEYHSQLRRLAHHGHGVVAIQREGKEMELNLKFPR